VGRFAAHRLANSTLVPSIIDPAWAIDGFWLPGDFNQPGTSCSSEPTPTRAPRLFLVPLLAGLGAIALFLPVPPFVPRLLIALAASGFLIIFMIIYRLQPSTHNAIMSLGILLWLLGNGLWMAGLPVYQVVPGWAGFLVLTIAGERLELARY
jgi:hypothetical protein